MSWDIEAVADVTAGIDIGVNVEMPTLIADKIKIINLAMPIDIVVFDMNPENLTVNYAAKFDNRKSTSKNQPAGRQTGQYTGSTAPEIKFTAILDQDYANELIDLNPLGEDSVRKRLELLGTWCRAEPGLFTMLASIGLAMIPGLGGLVNILQSPPLLLLQWGDPLNGGFVVQGYLKAVSAKFTRFSLGGNPRRAEVTCTFQEEPKSLLNMLTNPTSGGIPGRRGHTVTQGENLPSLAMANYGRPQDWRQLAAANGIDDPMRVRPGRKLYLPAPEELGS